MLRSPIGISYLMLATSTSLVVRISVLEPFYHSDHKSSMLQRYVYASRFSKIYRYFDYKIINSIRRNKLRLLTRSIDGKLNFLNGTILYRTEQYIFLKKKVDNSQFSKICLKKVA